MKDSNDNKYSEPMTLRVVISEQAEQSLLTEMRTRKCDNLSELIERLAAELELKRK